MTLKDIYKGSFKNRKRFDDGGAVSYYDSMPAYSTQFSGSADTSPVTYTAPDSATTGANSISSQVGDPMAGISNPANDPSLNIPSPSNGGSLGAGALGKLLGLGGSGGGGSTGLAALQALAGLAGAYGNFKNNQANTEVRAATFIRRTGWNRCTDCRAVQWRLWSSWRL